MRKLLIAVATAAALAPLAAHATIGYFSHGYGMKAKATGGVGIALPQDALAAASNPAGMAWVGNRFDLGLEWFMPDRGAEITGNIFPGVNGTYDGNGTSSFAIPEFGYNHMLNPNLVARRRGVRQWRHEHHLRNESLSPASAAPGEAGVDLMQLFIAPTLAWKSGNHSFGVSLNLAYQRFEAKGLQPFDNPFVSSSPGNVTNQGYDDSTGYGRAHRVDGTSFAQRDAGRHLPVEDEHEQVRQVQGTVRQPGRVRHPRELRRRHRLEGESRPDDRG